VRRAFRLAVAAAAVLAVFVAAGCSGSSSGTVTILLWSDYIDPALVERFQKEAGVKVVLDTYENTEQMMSKVTSASNQYDVVVMSDHAVRTMIASKVLGTLDLAKVPNAKNVAPRFRTPAYDPESKYSLPYQWGTMGLVYRKDKVPSLDPSWAVVLDPARQPGPVVLLDSMRDLIGAALLFKGYSANTRSAEELKAASAVLNGARTKNLLGFAGSPDSVGKVLAGDAWIGIAYNGDAVSRLDDSTEFVVPKEGTIIWVDAMTVPAKAPNRDGAHRFINFILDADVGAALSNYLSYATPNDASMPKIVQEIRENTRVYPTEAQMATMQILEDVREATQLYDQVWTRLKAGK
jgi:spermidine/putrescine transport system substrate-binding protein